MSTHGWFSSGNARLSLSAASARTIARLRLTRIVLVMVIVTGLLAAWTGPVTFASADERLVFAFFYPWESPQPGSSATRYIPREPYQPGNPAVIRRQFAQATSARIDAFIVSWTGSSLRQYLDLAQEQKSIRISAYIESEQASLRSRAGMVNGLRRLLASDAQHPAFVRYRGKPVIFVWRPDALERAPGQSVGDAWRSVLAEADPDRSAIWSVDGIDLSLLDAFDGLHQFGAALWTSDSTASNRAWRSRVDDYNRRNGTAKIWSPGTAPGHDNSRQRVDRPIVVDREGGAYYRRNFAGAIASNPDWICIVSWNEWGEATQIEPATEYGDLYLDITREMVGQWKGALPDRTPASVFERAWARADAPVASSAVRRGWLWGPSSFAEQREPYGEGEGGERLVRYYDKARMEITRPASDPAAAGYVTNGLLVRELIGGELQLSDTLFRRHRPGTVAVVGDANQRGAVTYADLAAIASWRGDNRAADRTGQPITERFEARRQPLPDAELLTYGINGAAYEATLGHNIAAPFWEFFQQVGPVIEAGSNRLGNGPVLDWLADVGLPLMEPVWVRASVAGTDRNVLLQCFERRCLTYTPDNAPEWRVEMGNVGRHYYQWRFGRG